MSQLQDQIISLFEGSPLFIASQILGLFLCILSFFVYSCKKREHILITKLISDVLSSIQQAMAGATTGALICSIAVTRDFVFYNRGRKKWATNIAWLFVYLIAMSISPFFTWQGPISLLPAIGSALAVVAFYCKRPLHTRVIGLFSQLLWLIYTVLSLNIISAVQNTILLISVLVGLGHDWREYKAKKKAIAD